MPKKKKEYDENSIQVLEFPDDVRKRPGMYIGGTTSEGMHHIFKEILDNSVTGDTPIVIKDRGVIKIIRIEELFKNFNEEGEISTKAPPCLEALSISRNGDQQWKKITRLYRHRIKHNLLSLKLQNGLNVNITDCHSVFKAKHDTHIYPVQGKDLEIKDPLVVPSNIKLGENVKQKIDLFEALAGQKANISTDVDIIIDYIKKHKEDVKCWCEKNGHTRSYDHQFKRFKFLPLDMIIEIGDLEPFEECSVGFKNCKINRFIDVNNDFMIFLGLYLAEGCVRHYPDGTILDATLSFGSHEKEIIEFANSTCERIFKFKPRVSNAHKTAVNIFLGKTVAYLCKYLKLGENCYTKIIPDIVWNVDEKMRKKFLLALVCGDGHCRHTNCLDNLISGEFPDSNEKITYVTSSIWLCESMTYLLLSLNVSFYYHKRKNKLAYSLEWYWNNKSSYRYRVNGKRSSSDIGSLKIKSIEKLNKNKYDYVYDISVKDNENFIGGIGGILLHNSVDESVAGHCKKILITKEDDGYISVLDNGRGIPTGINKAKGVSALELVFTVLHAGGKFSNDEEDAGYKSSGGLHGVGSSVTNAVSEHLEVYVKREGKVWHQEYERGIKKDKVKPVKRCRVEWIGKTGTFVRFKPDKQIFKHINIEWEIDKIKRRAREVCFLVPGLEIQIQGFGEDDISFKFDNGLNDYIDYYMKDKEPIIDKIPIQFDLKDLGCSAEVVFTYEKDYDEHVVSFANNICTHEGGVHLNAFLNALLKVIINIGEREKITKDFGGKVRKSDIQEGLHAVISIRLVQPEFEGQTKTKLGNPEIRIPLEEHFIENFNKLFERKYKKQGKIIAEKILQAVIARENARKAKELVRKKGSLEHFTIKGKLADCESKNPEECELFLVEGDCFHKDTLVIVKDGVKKISEIKTGDLVYTANHRYKKAIKRKPKIKKKKCKITIQGKTFICSEDHLWLVMRCNDDVAEWIKAKDLKEDDLIVKTIF